MPRIFSALLGKLLPWRSKAGATGSNQTNPAEGSGGPLLTPVFPRGNCAHCSFNRARAAGTQGAAAVCSIRGNEITEPLTTYCKNFDSGDPALCGAIYSILPAHGGIAIPWVDLAMPRVAAAACCVCGAQSSMGILLQLPDAEVGCCGPEHYLAWWSDYLYRRLVYFKTLGERAYTDMHDVVSFSTAAAYYSDAKEAFYSAISTARDLELGEEQRALEERLAHIKAVFRSQFK